MNPITNRPNRNNVNPVTMAMYIIGGVMFAIGAYVSSITRIYLYTGNETHPYLAVGIPIALVGLALALYGRFAAKRELSR
ncbi:MAG TPA: hypothetical protein VMW80_11445 [Candidatus Dormibacteraeota bacterium]|nr:hypothetical protein [Candidatus Dormibacteraeota bacterium]